MSVEVLEFVFVNLRFRFRLSTENPFTMFLRTLIPLLLILNRSHGSNAVLKVSTALYS